MYLNIVLKAWVGHLFWKHFRVFVESLATSRQPSKKSNILTKKENNLVSVALLSHTGSALYWTLQYGYYSPPITVAYSPTEIYINVAGQSRWVYSNTGSTYIRLCPHCCPHPFSLERSASLHAGYVFVSTARVSASRTSTPTASSALARIMQK